MCFGDDKRLGLQSSTRFPGMYWAEHSSASPVQLSTPAEEFSITTVDNRIIAAMRLVLVITSLLIVYVEPSDAYRSITLVYLVLTLYVLYSVVLYALAVYEHPFTLSAVRWAHWGDLAWYTVLIGLSSGVESIFFFGYFFAIFVASFRWGFTEGLRVSVAAAALFSVVGLLTAKPAPQLEIDRFLMRSAYLLALGFLMAYWGGFEITLKRRLALLREVNTFSNPRFGVDRTVGRLMERLRAFYDADACLLVVLPSQGQPYLRRAVPGQPEHALQPEPIPADLARLFCTLPQTYAAVYTNEARKGEWWRLTRSFRIYDSATGRTVTDGYDQCEALAELLDTHAFVTVAVALRDGTLCRLFLTSRRHTFDTTDAGFLLQTVRHVIPVIENIRLIDRLASDAAEQERQKIAHDLHDSIIQPYIGLQMGLAGVWQKLSLGRADVARDVQQLLALTDDGIAELRRYVQGLKGGGEGGGSLVPSVRRYAAKFAETTGIEVRVEAEADLRVNDRLAAEVFQMVAEGLSNVLRHTQATRAVIRLSCSPSYLHLRIVNEQSFGTPSQPFTPHSITERATMLGGDARVEQREDAATVAVDIPL